MLPDVIRKATNGFEPDRVLLEHGDQRINECHISQRKKEYDDGQKIVITGVSPEGLPVREVINLESRGRDITVKI